MISPGCFDLIIFDWDGTLLDSISPILHLMIDAAQSDPVSPQGMVLKNSGLLPVLEQIVYTDHTVQLNDLKVLLNLEGFTAFTQPAGLHRGIAELLEQLHQRGQKMAVIAGRPQAEVQAEIQELGIAHYFMSVAGATQDISKPDPAMLWPILAQVDCAPDRAVLVGDSALDMEMATLAGVSMIGTAYLTENHDQYCIERLTLWRPQAIAGSVTELSQLLLGS